MSCHLSHRLTTVHRSVSMALLYSVGYAAFMSHAQAATIGKTVITSAQHEPLAASIMVTDIKTADFSASLANSTIYQQMGLTPTDSMTVRFQPSSATSGHVLITTTKPVSKPFADVVLSINDGTQRNVIPKTLLMPLNNSLPITPTQNIVTGAKKPNLPQVSTTNAQPLTVRKGMPPPLFSTPRSSSSDLAASKAVATKLSASSIQLPSSQAANVQSPQIQAPKTSASLSAANTVIPSNTTPSAASRLNNDDIAVRANTTHVSPTSILDNTKVATPINDQLFDILNIKITRQIQLNHNKVNDVNKNDNTIMVTAPMAVTPDNSLSTAKVTSYNTVAANTLLNKVPSSEIPYSNAQSNQTTAPQVIATNALSTVANASTVENATTSKTSSNNVNYTVQRNDNLWLIAQQIAEKNNLDVQTVMSEIQAQNPNAFINKNADQLKANAQLSLPNYDVMPTQKKLQEAIRVQRQYNRQRNTTIAKKPDTPKTALETVAETSVTTRTQTLPTAQFSVLAPGHDGSADGTKNKTAMATGNGLSSDVLDILKSSRQSTVAEAQRLSKTNSTLGGYTKKLQLQNQKLAELQARLEKLRNQ